MQVSSSSIANSEPFCFSLPNGYGSSPACLRQPMVVFLAAISLDLSPGRKLRYPRIFADRSSWALVDGKPAVGASVPRPASTNGSYSGQMQCTLSLLESRCIRLSVIIYDIST